LVWLALGLPLALWGLACHALPYWLTGKTVALLGRTAEEEATDKMAAGLVLYPMCWALEGWLVWRLAGLALFLTFLLAVIPSGVLALAWRERSEEHTSELQSRFDLVCRLLLEKKKKTRYHRSEAAPHCFNWAVLDPPIRSSSP